MMNDTKILEEKLAYQEHLLQDLNEVIGEFTVRVLRLERLVKELQDVAVFDTGPQSEKPPHY